MKRAVHDVSTAAGLLGHFEDRVQRRSHRVQRRKETGKLHPLDTVYLEHARQDLTRVRALVGKLDGQEQST